VEIPQDAFIVVASARGELACGIGRVEVAAYGRVVPSVERGETAPVGWGRGGVHVPFYALGVVGWGTDLAVRVARVEVGLAWSGCRSGRWGSCPVGLS